MEAIILAGGLGTRLKSKLTDTPKSMAPIGSRTFLAILLDELIDQGCDRVILSVGHLRHVIIDAFGNQCRNVALDYVIEESALGTGGAIRLALQHAQEPSVLVLNGDTYLKVDFAAMLAFHLSAGAAITMAVTPVDDVGRYGGVRIENEKVSSFTEKGRQGPGWINGGTYAMKRDFPWPAMLPPSFSFESEVLGPCLQKLRPAAFRCKGYFLDIGIPEDLDRAQNELAAGKTGAQSPVHD
jgi:D-glycero-alpha-D-manno-heptose 1-phosphate guanylyltransferase